METTYHIPVLLQESIEALNINPSGVYVDVTFGGGGHSREILKHLDTSGRLIAFDRDEDALRNVPDDSRFILIRNNFRFLRNLLRYTGFLKVDGILADLGVSSHHFDEGERGFSFRFGNSDLDMRMNRNAKLTAKDVLNTYSLEALTSLFREYGEINNAYKLAKSIVSRRNVSELKQVSELSELCEVLAPKFDSKQYLAKVFQALRIEVNKEMDALKHFLEQTTKVLNPQGRLVVISYHSLEDRLVKNFMRSGNIEGRIEKDFFGKQLTPFEVISKKAVVPTEDEIRENGRARSAKLRIAEYIENGREE